MSEQTTQPAPALDDETEVQLASMPRDLANAFRNLRVTMGTNNAAKAAAAGKEAGSHLWEQIERVEITPTAQTDPADTANDPGSLKRIDAESEEKERAKREPAVADRTKVVRRESEAVTAVLEPTQDLKNKVSRLPVIQNRIIAAATTIQREDLLDVVYQHSLFCQIALPRSRPKERVFERVYRNGSVKMRAGELWNGFQWIEQPLPAGPKPRLALLHIHNQAIKTRSPYIDIGHSCAEFLRRLQLNDQDGRTYRLFKREMQALAACHMTLGFAEGENVVTLDAKPITRFEAWLSANNDQGAFWPGNLQLSLEYFESLLKHAVPLDPRAIAALSHSALALDVYSFFARRLFTLKKPVKVFWHQFLEQFGHEYTGPDALRNFKKNWLPAVRTALTVYPSAKVELVTGGLLLRPSPPPVHPEAVAVSHGLAKQVRQRLPAPKSIKPETIERFRKLYPRLDPYACEADFKAWVETKEQPRNFDKAFLGFAKSWAKGKC